MTPPTYLPQHRKRSVTRCVARPAMASKPLTEAMDSWNPRWRASPLLVILHYLLKNNTTFMAVIVQGKMSPHPTSSDYFIGGGH